MINKSLFTLTAASLGLALLYINSPMPHEYSVKALVRYLPSRALISQVPAVLHIQSYLDTRTIYTPNEVETMLHQLAPTLNEAVIHKILTTINCAKAHHIEHNHILTIIDYSLPSSEKRLWIFDLNQRKLLFHTYVSHGLRSGTLLSQFFSNKNNSKASSIGVYKTDKAYYGKQGLSLRLQGLDVNFNDNASNRAVVMHGGWYVDESFIKKYGRAGRSWGCPALPLTLYHSIIDTIKENSLLVIYYPSDKWFAKSKFLTCNQLSASSQTANLSKDIEPPKGDLEHREAVLFANVRYQKSALEESAPILAVSAESYEHLFHTKPPLSRMIRRQVNHTEYVALSTRELKSMIQNHVLAHSTDIISFVLPNIKMVNGYFSTEMKIVNLGKIKEIGVNVSKAAQTLEHYTVYFETNRSISLISTDRFIRWVGL